jgi:hypothetical protein
VLSGPPLGWLGTRTDAAQTYGMNRNGLRLRRTAVALAALSIPLGALAVAPVANAGQKTQAKRLLQGKSYTTHASGRITNATIDRTAHLCPGGRLIYESTFVDAETGSSSHTEVSGTWRVTKAKINRRRTAGWARVRYRPDGGQASSVTITSNSRGVRFDGIVTEVARSSRC